jgi:FKBP-type peptidyl-prolyl cis-trans isomerase FkpA
MSAAAATWAGNFFFQSVAADPGWMFNPTYTPFVTQKLQEIFSSSQAAASGVPALAGIAQLNENMAQMFGGILGVGVAPPAPTPPAPKPTDAGMTNTMPSPTDPNWVAVGTDGLKMWDVVVGTGTPVATGDTITVFYSGWLSANGTLFDSRRSPAAPATFALSGLIQGWQEGIPGMKPGGIRRLLVPSALGYGAAGSPPNIPANADLVFEIKLVSSHP